MSRKLSLAFLLWLGPNLLLAGGIWAAEEQGLLRVSEPRQERTLGNEDSHTWDVPLSGNRFAKVEIEPLEGELEVVLLDPSGAHKVSSTLFPDEAEVHTVDWVSAEAGTWRLELTASDPSSAASYGIELVETRRARRRHRQGWHAVELDQEVSLALDSGSLPESRATTERAIAAKEKVLSDAPREMAAYLDDLGFRFYAAPIESMEVLEVAASMFRHALEVRLGHGDEVLTISENLQNLSTVSFDLGRYQESESYQRRGLTLLIEDLGQGDPKVAMARLELAKVLFLQARYAEAARETQLAIDFCGPDEAVCSVDGLLVLSEVRRVQNRLGEAEATARRAIARAEEGLGEEWDSLLDGLTNNLAVVLQDMGRYAEAEVLLRPLLERWVSDPDNFFFQLPTAYLNMAEVYRPRRCGGRRSS